jgi:hypothetical protein
MIGGRNALLGAASGSGYGNWTGNYSDVSLLLRGDSAPTTILTPFDESPTPKTITVAGNASISTATFKYGTSALSFAGTGGMSAAYGTDLDLAAGDFTIEAWIRFNTLPSNGVFVTLVSRYTATARSYHWGFYYSAHQGAYFFYFDWTTDNSTRKLAYATIPTPNLSAFSHYAVVRSGNEILLFVDGQKRTLSGQDSPIGTFFNQSTPLEVGTANSIFGSIALNGFIDDLRVTPGIARYTANFTPPTAELPANITDDPSYNSVSLLLRGNGTPTIILTPFDESPTPKTLTVVGNAGISTTTFKYGDSSLTFGGSGDYLTIPSNTDFAFGTGDFTVEFWFNTSNTTTRQDPISVYTSTTGFGVALSYDNATDVTFYNGNTILINTTGAQWTGNTWNHLAVSRSGTTLRAFINGNQIASVTNSTNFTVASSLFIGAAGNASLPLNGFIDDLRITKGVARYTANFTPPAAQLPANITDDPSYNSVSLLLRNGTPYLEPSDESATPKTITTSGAAAITTTTGEWKYSGSALSFTKSSNSYLEAGTGNDPAFDFGSGDFTIEAWIRPSVVSGFNNVVSTFVGPYQGEGWMVVINSGQLGFNTYEDSGNPSINISGGTITANAYAHIAVVRNNTTLRGFVNGVQAGSTTVSGNLITTNALTKLLRVGRSAYTGGTYDYGGQIDDLRITKGIARYTKNFLPPPAQLPAI